MAQVAQIVTINNAKRYRWIAYIAVALILFGLSEISSAQEILDRVDQRFLNVRDTWYSRIRGYAENLFWMLVSVDVAWTGVLYVLEKNDIGEMAVSFTKKLLTIGFFYALLKFSDTWIPAIIDSLRSIGQNVGGSSATPDGVIGVGMDLALALIDHLGDLGAMDKIAMVFPIWLCVIIIFAAFCFVSAVLLITLVESYLAIGAGVILLGFGGSRWTTDFATKYLQYAFATGLKLMLIYLVIGAGQTLVSDMQPDTNNLFASTLSIIATAFVYAYLVIQIPAIASGMMSGSPSLTASGLMTSAIGMGAAMVGASAMAKSTMGGGLSAAGGAAAGATGLAKAVGAGLDSAADLGKTGAAAASHAVGEVAGHGLGMAGAAIGSAVAGASSSFGERVANSTGGQIAAGIENTRGGSISGAQAPAGAPANQGGAGAAPNQGAPAKPAAAGGGSGPAAAASSAPASVGAATGAGAMAGNAVAAPSYGVGDATGAAFDSGSTSPQASGDQGYGRKLHEKINDLQGYVPDEMSGNIQGAHIQIGHTQD